MSRHVLISGATGFVGRFIAEHFLARGDRVTAMGRTPPVPGFFSAPVVFVEGGLDPARDFSSVFAGVDAFVHAAFDHVAGKYRGGEGDDAAGFRRRNLDGSVALFQAAKTAGVARVVFLSTRAVYGTQAAGAMLQEDMVPQPDTLYGAVKLLGEQALAKLSDEALCGASLRVTGVYGPAGHGRAHKWQTLFDDYLAGRPVASRVATEVHGADVAAAVALMLDAPADAVCGQVFNVSDLVVDHRDLLGRVRALMGVERPLPERADAAALNVMATERLRSLGWRPGGADALDAFVRAVVRGLLAR
ncbi:NAD-dependent epimerase/dehydratase family protein [Mesorhizobium sp. NBSH29]|uniref:NAD-dependent epimerase/dehydratase family protein n=1 Tax=Mesorhizobium sp. NBSH29 TaxID=2654249 RepID=UPI0018968B24|nr:NAD(P)-dependent oxidoreductase [Mesorhizobium sp. NBSH29]QPC88399.1 NAD-dependent epimerase/dehydratase family protein [Mesorhizobium sp. NBSH29]